MKKLLPLFTIFLLTTPLFAQWVQQNSGTTADLYDVFAITENTVVVVGANGTILKTTDGGVNWIPKTSGTTYHLRKVAFANSTTGYAVGFHGTLLKTTDAGETWTALNAGTTEDLYGLSVINENLFFLSGTNGLLKKTVNAGSSWTTLSTPSNEIVKDIQFFSEQIGYMQVGGIYDNSYCSLIKTIDYGLNWLLISDYMFSFHFLNQNIGFEFCVGGLSKTTNGGVTFTNLNPITLSCIYATNENIVWGASFTAPIGYPTATFRGEILYNQEFQDVVSYTYGLFAKSIYFYNETTGYMVGLGGAIYKNSTGILLSSQESEFLNHINVYPNPATSEIHIQLEETAVIEYKVQLFNTLGQEVLTQNIKNTSETTLNVEHLHSGVYFLYLSTPQNTYPKK